MIGGSSTSRQEAASADATNSLLNPSLILLSPHVTSQVPPLGELHYILLYSSEEWGFCM